MFLLFSSSAIGGLLIACGDDETPVTTPTGDGGQRDSQFPGDVEKQDVLTQPDGNTSHFCKGSQDTANARCDDFDDGPTSVAARGWTVVTTQDGGGPRLITDGAAPSAPHALDMVADPVILPPKPDAGPDAGDAGDGGTVPIFTDTLPKSIITDVVTVDKLKSTLEADVFVAEHVSGAYRVLRFDFGPTPQDLTGLTLDVTSDGKWRCVGYGLQALGQPMKKGVWQHIKLIMVTEGTNLKASCEVDTFKTAQIPGQLSPSPTRRLEIGVTTYAANTPRTRLLYDNIDFHAE